jgi:hypothetical protein
LEHPHPYAAKMGKQKEKQRTCWIKANARIFVVVWCVCCSRPSSGFGYRSPFAQAHEAPVHAWLSLRATLAFLASPPWVAVLPRPLRRLGWCPRRRPPKDAMGSRQPAAARITAQKQMSQSLPPEITGTITSTVMGTLLEIVYLRSRTA